ncbi:MAG: alpha/beta hydrolase [Polyangia bacterium]
MSIVSRQVVTPRLQIKCLDTGGSGQPVLFVHGNISTSEFFADLLLKLPPAYRGIAPDLRGFGDTEAKPIDATRGVDDFVDDIASLIDSIEGLAGKKVVLCGWSVGGAVVLRYAMKHPDRVAGLVLEAPMSPFGFGGTRDAVGTPCFADFAGSGAGTASPPFVERLAQKDRSADSDFSPRNIVRGFFVKAGHQIAAAEEDRYVDEILKTQIGADHYPGDAAGSANWPTVAPGTRGMNNAISPKYVNLSGFAKIPTHPKVLWIRGTDDQIVSDTSLFCFGFLGKLGVIPGWPGDEAYPAQPMVSQMRTLLNDYRANGGSYEEVVLTDCGHSPHLEKPTEFREKLLSFLHEIGV